MDGEVVGRHHGNWLAAVKQKPPAGCNVGQCRRVTGHPDESPRGAILPGSGADASNLASRNTGERDNDNSVIATVGDENTAVGELAQADDAGEFITSRIRCTQTNELRLRGQGRWNPQPEETTREWCESHI